MKVMLLIYSDEKSWTEETHAQCREDSSQVCHDINEKGQYILASPLQSVSTAMSVRIRDGKRMVTKGPFAETAEQLGGFYLLDVDSIDEAIEIASRLPPAKKGTVEVRPIMEMTSLPVPGRDLSEAHAGKA
jgi:hypothetical protein